MRQRRQVEDNDKDKDDNKEAIDGVVRVTAA